MNGHASAVVVRFVAAVNRVCASRRERGKRRCGACGVLLLPRGRMAATDVGVEVAALSWVHSDDIPEQRRAASAAFVLEEEDADGGDHENRRRGRRFPPFCSNRTLPSIRLTSPSLQFMNSTATLLFCLQVCHGCLLPGVVFSLWDDAAVWLSWSSSGDLDCPPKILKSAFNVSITRRKAQRGQRSRRNSPGFSHYYSRNRNTSGFICSRQNNGRTRWRCCFRAPPIAPSLFLRHRSSCSRLFPCVFSIIGRWHTSTFLTVVRSQAE